MAAPKILPLGNVQINLTLPSLIRIFVKGGADCGRPSRHKTVHDMMNGIRIRPFEAAAILAALTLLTGCSLLKFSVDTGGEPLSKEETRMRLLTRGFYYEASDEVTAAADSIAAGSDDAELQRRTIRWKLRTTRAAVDAATPCPAPFFTMSSLQLTT